MLRRGQEFIDSKIDDETLTRAVIAGANNMGVRYVNKLFEREGYSLGRWVRMRRPERCRLDLEDPPFERASNQLDRLLARLQECLSF